MSWMYKSLPPAWVFSRSDILCLHVDDSFSCSASYTFYMMPLPGSQEKWEYAKSILSGWSGGTHISCTGRHHSEDNTWVLLHQICKKCKDSPSQGASKCACSGTSWKRVHHGQVLHIGTWQSEQYIDAFNPALHDSQTALIDVEGSWAELPVASAVVTPPVSFSSASTNFNLFDLSPSVTISLVLNSLLIREVEFKSLDFGCAHNYT